MKENQAIKATKEQLEERLKEQQIQVRNVREEAKKLQTITDIKIQELSNLLLDS